MKLPKHYPHHDESTWFCRLLSKEESERLLRGRVDETFLVRATDLSGPTHVYNVDVVWVAVLHVAALCRVHVWVSDVCVCHLLFFRVQGKVVSLPVHRELDWLSIHGWKGRYDSINTLVMHCATGGYPIPVGDHDVHIALRYPVKYYLKWHFYNTSDAVKLMNWSLVKWISSVITACSVIQHFNTPSFTVA